MPIHLPTFPTELFRLGPVAVRWYGVMYLVGYVLGGRLATRRAAAGRTAVDAASIDTLIVALFVGMLLGARIAYVLLYQPALLGEGPVGWIALWRGGLSFHGAIVGMAGASAWFAHRERLPVLAVTDLVVWAGTPGLFFGRLGNFINGELWGRPTSLPWGMVFPRDTSGVPRHPSQLYEAVGEGLVIFALLWFVDRRSASAPPAGRLTATFLIGYGVVRFLIEFTRQPDVQLGLLSLGLSMGQWLCLAMIATGTAIARVSASNPPRPLPAT